ncbi:hypothetical protein XELAEV_18034134mg [Xenopus laevis]|uniref:Uncharacterized protein n=1 Tax=Xenopus laevis TaxID=8355 RepID=A0A974CKL9_XENLA|nr:hypothetical protein XELAEV_18034134mg [Xenopus laevis]
MGQRPKFLSPKREKSHQLRDPRKNPAQLPLVLEEKQSPIPCPFSCTVATIRHQSGEAMTARETKAPAHPCPSHCTSQ